MKSEYEEVPDRTRSVAEEAFHLQRLHTQTEVFEIVKKINVPEKQAQALKAKVESDPKILRFTVGNPK